MAITKTYIGSDGTVKECMRSLYTWLQENAVGKYFDSVEFDDTLTYNPVSCYVGDTLFLRFQSKNPDYTPTRFGANVTTTAGTTVIGDSITEEDVVQYVHACKNGFFLSTANYAMPLCVTLDNSGKPCILWQGGFAPPTESDPVELWTIGLDTAAVSGRNFCKPPASDRTCLTPIPLCDCNGAYTPNAFLMPFSQYREPGVLDINGTRYLSNGLWCIKDE